MYKTKIKSVNIKFSCIMLQLLTYLSCILLYIFFNSLKTLQQNKYSCSLILFMNKLFIHQTNKEIITFFKENLHKKKKHFQILNSVTPENPKS